MRRERSDRSMGRGGRARGDGESAPARRGEPERRLG